MINTLLVKDGKTTPESLGAFLRAEREKHKISQKVLGDRLGIYHVTLANIEKGKSFDYRALLKLLHYFDKDVEIKHLSNDAFKNL